MSNKWKKTYFYVCTIMAQVEPESSETIEFNHLMGGDDAIVDLAIRFANEFEGVPEYDTVYEFLKDKL